MSTENKKPSNPRMHNPDGMYASEARLEDCVTLRDYFANSAMQGLLSSYIGSSDVYSDIRFKSEEISKRVYQLADAMLKQREL